MLNLSKIFPTYFVCDILTQLSPWLKSIPKKCLSLPKSFILNLSVSMSFTSLRTFSSLAAINKSSTHITIITFAFSVSMCKHSCLLDSAQNGFWLGTHVAACSSFGPIVLAHTMISPTYRPIFHLCQIPPHSPLAVPCKFHDLLVRSGRQF